MFGRALKDRNIQEFGKFEFVLNQAHDHEKDGGIAAISSWLDSIFGNGSDPG